MRVALDAMGGDAAPAVTVEGAVEAARQGTAVLLVGREADLRAELARFRDWPDLPIELRHAPEVVEMGEHPANAVRRKKQASINVAMQALAEGQAEAVYSAGNSGAVMAAALFRLGRLEGVLRPAIGVTLPLPSGQCFLLDAGANADCEPIHLLQFAHLGAAYVRHAGGIAQPRVGLVSMGEEETKGNALVLATHPLLRTSGLQFTGNVEGKDLTRGAVDVAVCDGFTGNVILKLAEGMVELIGTLVRSEVRRKVWYRAPALLLRPVLRQAFRRLDYTEYGGAPLLGVRGAVFIGHGRSNAKAIANGLRAAARAADVDLVEKLRGALLDSSAHSAAPVDSTPPATASAPAAEGAPATE